MAKITYTTSGSVRGGCGHQHRTLEAAVRCLRQDQNWCRSQGGYSDRQVVYGDGERLSEEDYCATCDIHWRQTYPLG